MSDTRLQTVATLAAMSTDTVTVGQSEYFTADPRDAHRPDDPSQSTVRSTSEL